MSEMDEYYQILGLKSGASEEEVKRAYKELAFVWHPDRFPDSKPHLKEIANEKFKEVKLAYEKLMDLLKYSKMETFESEGEQPGEATQEAHRGSEPPPHETPPEDEKEQSSTREGRGYEESKSSPNKPPPDFSHNSTQKSTAHSSWMSVVVFFGIVGLVIIFVSLQTPPTSSPPSSSQPPTDRYTTSGRESQRESQPSPREPPPKPEEEQTHREVKELVFTPDQMEKYALSYKDPYVLHIRKVINNYLGGKLVGDDNYKDLEAVDQEYLKNKFIVFSIINSLMGGREIFLISQKKPAKMFRTWVYQRESDYELREFDVDPRYGDEEITKIRIIFGQLLQDENLAL